MQRSLTTRILKWGVPAVMAGSLLWTGLNSSYACNPSLIPPCSRTAYVAKSVNQCVVNPPAGGPVAVPVTFVPFAEWNTAAICAQPSTHSLNVTIQCTEFPGGGTPITIGPINVPMADNFPTVPGNQPLASGAQFPVMIPNGQLTPGKQYTCTVMATYDIDFRRGSGPLGRGMIRGTGDAEFCVNDPSPVDDTISRLAVYHVDLNGEDFTRMRKGDQAVEWYLVVNNDPNEFACIDCTASTSQAARTAQGLDGDTTLVHGLSPVGDDPAVAYSFDLDPGSPVVLPPDPDAQIDVHTTCTTVLAPGEMKWFSPATRSYGSCKDGSCSESAFFVTGEFSDGTPALGGAGVVQQVDPTGEPVLPLCFITDSLTVDPDSEVVWSAMTFEGGGTHLVTHAGGNRDLAEIGSMGWQLDGANAETAFQRTGQGWPDTLSDMITVHESEFPDTASYGGVEFHVDPSADGGFTTNGVDVKLTDLLEGIDEVVGQRAARDLSFWATPGLDSDFNQVETWTDVSLRQEGERRACRSTVEGLHAGDCGVVARGTGRQLEVWCPPPGARPHLLANGVILAPTVAFPVLSEEAAAIYDITKFETIDSAGATTRPVAGSDRIVSIKTDQDGLVIVEGDYTNAVAAPAFPNICVVDVPVPDAAPSMVSYPVAGRLPFTNLATEITAAIDPLVTKAKVKISYKQGKKPKPKDSASISFPLPVEDGFDPEGKKVVVDFGGVVRVFFLDKRGNNAVRSKTESFKIKAKKKKGVVAAQDAKATFKLKRSDISALLKDEEILDRTLPKAGESRTVRLAVYFCGQRHEVDVELLVKSKAGKSASGKSPKRR